MSDRGKIVTLAGKLIDLDDIGSGSVVPGSVNTAALQDGAVTAAKVAADVATQAELDAVAATIPITAGGVLAGSFPNPGFAADMATQAELDAIAAAARVESRLLANPTAIGDTQIVLDKVFTSASLAAGCVIVAPGTTNAEIRQVTAGSGTTTLTLLNQRNWTAVGDTKVTAATKTIYWHRPATSLSVSANTLTIVLSEAMSALAVGQYIAIWGTTNYNRRYIGPVRTKSGDAKTFTVDWWEAAPAAETAGYITHHTVRHFNKNFRVGDTFKISASAVGNNGTYTVASVDQSGQGITVNEAFPGGDEETNLTFTWNLNKAHPAGSTVWYIPDRRILCTWYGLVSGSADQGDTIQNLLWDMGAITGESFWPPGTFSSSKMLCAPAQQMTGMGGGALNSIINKHANFPNVADDTYFLLASQSTSGGVPNINRLQLRNMRFGGGINTAQPVLITVCQQPQTWENVRVDNTGGGEGIVVLASQQAVFLNTEVIHGIDAITLQNAEFCWFYGLDCELQTGAYIHVKPYGLTQSCAVWGGHCEVGAGMVLVDCDFQMKQMVFDGIAYAGTQVMNVAPIDSTNQVSYTLRNIWGSTEASASNYIVDTPGAITLAADTFFRGQIDFFHRPAQPSNATPRDPSKFCVFGAQGQRVQMAPDLATSAVMVIRQPDANTGDILRIDSDAVTGLWKLNPDGYMIVKKNAAPADAALAANEMAIWFDPTNGASKLMVKAKQADGTVKTATVALA